MLLPENLSSSGGLLMRGHSGGEGVGPLKTKRKDSGTGDTAEQPGPCGPWGVGGGHVAGGTGEYRVGDPLLTSRLRQCQQRWLQTETRPRPQGVRLQGNYGQIVLPAPAHQICPALSNSSPNRQEETTGPSHAVSPNAALCGLN